MIMSIYPHHMNGNHTKKNDAGIEGIFQFLAVVLVFLGSIQAVTIAVSLTRTSISRMGAIAIVLGSLLVAGGYRHLLGRPRSGRSLRPGFRSLLPPLILGVVIVAVLLYLLLWVTAYALPDTGFDGLWYHNPTMHFWAAKGYVHWIDGGDGDWSNLINRRFNGWPKGVELLGFIMVRATGLSHLLNAFNLPFLLVGMYSIFCLSRLFGASRSFSLMAGSLFLFVPVNIVLSLTTLIDPAVASCYIALFAMVAFTVRTIGSRKIPWKLAPGLGCALGLSISSKGTGVILLPMVCGILLIVVVIVSRRKMEEEGRKRLKARSSKPASDTFFSKSLLFILIAVIFMTTSGGYWHLRNWIYTGSPVYPIGLTVAGYPVFPGIALDTIHPPPYAHGTEEWSQTKRILFSWLDNLAGWREAITGKDPKSGGLGLLWIFGCIPAIIILLFQFGAEKITPGRGSGQMKVVSAVPFLAVFLMALTMFFAMPADHNHKIRYVLWIYGLGLPCFAVVAERVWKSGLKILRRGGIIWVCLSVAVIVFEGLYSFQHQIGLLLNYHRREQGEEVTLFRTFFGRYPTDYFWGDFSGSAFNSILGDKRAIAFGPIRVMAQPILGHVTQEQAFGERKIYFLDPVMAADPGRVIDYIRQRSIRYVIWDEGMPVPPPLRKMAILDETAGRFFRVLVIDPGENLAPSAQSSKVP